MPTNNFQANQTYFYLLFFAHSIVNWFKRTCLPSKFQNATVPTIRTEFLVLPAGLIKSSHHWKSVAEKATEALFES
ncbi:MAG: transposase [Candidatus Omnitrophica bacterium]|nr:transposase [Candidatus Omnitrophota bacterium]